MKALYFSEARKADKPSPGKLVHIGNRRTLTTRCGKPVARRWWVEAGQTLKTRSGVLLAKHLATCRACGAR